MDDVNQSFLECAKHPTSTGCRGGNLNTHLAYTMSFGDEAMDKSVFFFRRRVCYQFTDLEGWMAWSAWTGTRTNKMESSARDSRPLIRPLYHAPS